MSAPHRINVLATCQAPDLWAPLPQRIIQMDLSRFPDKRYISNARHKVSSTASMLNADSRAELPATLVGIEVRTPSCHVPQSGPLKFCGRLFGSIALANLFLSASVFRNYQIRPSL